MALPILDGNQTAATLSTVLTSGEHIPAHTVVSLGSQAITDVRSAVSGSVVSISNFPPTQTIAGTVTANVDFAGANGATAPAKVVPIGYIDINTGNLAHVGNDSGQGLPSKISEVSIYGVGDRRLPDWLDGDAKPNVPISGTVTADINRLIGGAENFISIAGEGSGGAGVMVGFRNSAGETSIVGVTQESGAGPLPISGTVTAAAPNGSLTTRFGTPTTANVSFATSAVTNASRKYLLIQNVTTGSNVITVGIGFTPTTTQGIQLTAGAGITFESSYIPTGAVYVLSSVTASNFTILEA